MRSRALALTLALHQWQLLGEPSGKSAYGIPHTGRPQDLENHYRSRPLGWGAILSHYRGDVIHHGYLDIFEGGHDWRELAAVRTHQYDALARVILRILRFDGGYSSWPVPYSGSFAVDWVKPQYRASALGY